MAIVLVIEDEPLVRDTIRLSLETGGYEVIIASDGREGVAMINNNEVDVVVTDLIMPEQEGLETIRIIRRDHPKTKVIAISGGGRHVGTDYLKAASLLGADFALQKPFSMSHLRECVAECLARK
ncbi:MAG: response regulator [Parvibaculum sp.]|jgi:DNA-binding response OmpR family regulator|uniref:response regulator n=1 Tax=Parvibaculum sp. TaxID=2024848 RepID=UPI0025CC366E|nr:response regulator [Parvibaculum sp.]MCE9649815.1 response regulator [Parvibaculum sp.]